jgi:hypothetical protein
MSKLLGTNFFLFISLSLILGVLGFALGAPLTARAAESIVDTFPSLQKHVYSEKASNTYIGFGISPITIVNSKIGFSANIFQLHWIKNRYDFEIFSASYGLTMGQSSTSSNQFFVLRTAPKIRLFGSISIGPVLGLEFVNFSNLQAELNKNNQFTPMQPFSALGAIYGVNVSENFALDRSYTLKINQIVYNETYSYSGTNNGWNYYFNSSAINTDPSPIKPSTVIVLEISLLY